MLAGGVVTGAVTETFSASLGSTIATLGGTSPTRVATKRPTVGGRGSIESAVWARLQCQR
jgi:hypothetical protein